MVKKRKPKPLFFVVIIFFCGLFLITIGGLLNYLSSPVDRNNDTSIEVVIPQGTSTRQIGKILKEKNLIKSDTYFSLYLKLNKKILKAATYNFSQNMSLFEIINVLEKGSNYDPDRIVLTLKEGQRVTGLISSITKSTNYTEEEIKSKINDRAYLNTLINKYWFLTNEILNKDIYYPLEGYLSPDTYFFKKDVEIEEIIETLLAETEEKLKDYKDILANQNIHDIITMASIAELEGKTKEDRKNIVGVFNNRLAINMHLGSDVTTYYALQKPMTESLNTQQFNTINPYNTRPTSALGLPVGPICNPSIISVEAALNPAKNEYYYFVANNKGVVYFSKTAQEQNKVIQELKSKGEWQ